MKLSDIETAAMSFLAYLRKAGDEADLLILEKQAELISVRIKLIREARLREEILNPGETAATR